MFAYIWCCPVILLAVLGISAATNSSEKIADVIKNITRVNNVLQELIENYEHLQNIYKSQEIVEVTEDIQFREKNVSSTKRNSFVVTTMYYSDEEKTSEGLSEETKEDKVETTPRATVIMNLTTKGRITSQKGRAQVIFIDTRQKIRSMKENQTQVRNTTKKTRFNVLKSGPERSKTKKPKLLTYTVNDTNKFTKTPTTSLSTKPIRNELEYLAEMYKNIFAKFGFNLAKTTAMVTATRKKKTKNAPGWMFFLRDQMNSNLSKVTNNVKFNHISKETRPVARYRKSNNTDLMLTMDSGSNSGEGDKSTDSSDEGVLAKDIARTDILGKEYGDACLKLVVRKCYKVCKAVYKYICSSKCKDEFEDDFDKFSRTGCIQSFVPKEAVQELTRMCTDETNCTGVPHDGSSSHDEFSSDTSEEEVSKKKLKKKNKKTKKKSVLRGHFFRFNINENTHGYLTAVCQMPRSNTQNLTITTEPASNITSDERNLNILRAKYEKACIKTSREKCKDACTYAYTKACETNKCKKKQKENFGKQCVRRCKIAFKLEGKKKGSSSSSESSDNDDDDDDDDSDSDD